MRATENLYLDERGAWKAKYIPGAQVPGAIPDGVPAHPGVLQEAEELDLLEPTRA
jgi:hypothetical protein